MAISVSPGVLHQNKSSQSLENLTNSTATTAQTVSVTTLVTAISGGTATGTNSVNVYLLPDDAPDGTEKIIYMEATGEATVRCTMATGLHNYGRDVAGAATATNIAGALIGAATGAFILGAKGSWLKAMMLNGGWTILGGSATWATAT